MRGLDQKLTNGIALGETNGCAEANQLQHMRQRRTPRLQFAESSRTQATPDPLKDTSVSLAVVKEQLSGARNENERLKANNEQLVQALADASQRVVAALHAAHHDGLTGLPNRLMLIKRLQQAIRTASQRQRQLALLFIDLDGFKAVNDGLGHAVADRLLTVVAARIATCVRAEDIASRYGGDEFVVLLTNFNDVAIAVGIVEKIRDHLGERYSIDGNDVHVSASIGLAMYPDDGERYDALLNRADAAMYRDKAARRARAASLETSFAAGTGQRETTVSADPP